MKRSRSKKLSQSSKSKIISLFRDSQGRFAPRAEAESVQRASVVRDARGRFLKSKKNVAFTKPRKLSKREREKIILPRKGRIRKPVSLASELMKRFAGTKPENVSIRAYVKYGTLHKTYSVDPNKEALTKFLKRFGKKNVNLVLVYLDKNNEIQYRSTQATSVSEPVLLLKFMDRLINKYQSAQEITSIESFEADIWGKIEAWEI